MDSEEEEKAAAAAAAPTPAPFHKQHTSKAKHAPPLVSRISKRNKDRRSPNTFRKKTRPI